MVHTFLNDLPSAQESEETLPTTASHDTYTDADYWYRMEEAHRYLDLLNTDRCRIFGGYEDDLHHLSGVAADIIRYRLESISDIDHWVVIGIPDYMHLGIWEDEIEPQELKGKLEAIRAGSATSVVRNPLDYWFKPTGSVEWLTQFRVEGSKIEQYTRVDHLYRPSGINLDVTGIGQLNLFAAEYRRTDPELLPVFFDVEPIEAPF